VRICGLLLLVSGMSGAPAFVWAPLVCVARQTFVALALEFSGWDEKTCGKQAEVKTQKTGMRCVESKKGKGSADGGDQTSLPAPSGQELGVGAKEMDRKGE
jgi:hypothetical protein